MRSTVLLAAAIGLSHSLIASAAYIHEANLPAGTVANAKSSGNFIYLEGETATAGASDTYSSSVDVGHTFYRTSATPNDSYWGSSAIDYNGYRNMSRGSDTGSVSGLTMYWENLTTGVAAGTYDVYIRAYPSGNGSQTFSLSAADSIANLATGSTTGPATTVVKTSAALQWLKLGSINLTDTSNTFGLSISTSTSTIRFDTIVIVPSASAPVPEAASLSLLGLGALALLARKR